MSTPPRAALVTAASTAAGVAIASAQGEAATSKDMPRRSAVRKSVCISMRIIVRAGAATNTSGTNLRSIFCASL
ncbi:MAG: hypothetical protein BWY75_03820 [bacterium ADurb.Bin425]|nr:MAG: hypothetical protein BWY75_03820 [bacterium ADurb.Bin425]